MTDNPLELSLNKAVPISHLNLPYSCRSCDKRLLFNSIEPSNSVSSAPNISFSPPPPYSTVNGCNAIKPIVNMRNKSSGALLGER